METKLKYIIHLKYIYCVVIIVVFFVEVLDLDYSSENPPEKKLYDKMIKVSSITSPTSAFVQL